MSTTNELIDAILKRLKEIEEQVGALMEAQGAPAEDEDEEEPQAEETVTCPFGREHPASDRLCECGVGHDDYIVHLEGETLHWNGGFWDLKHEMALQPDARLHPESSEGTGQWALSKEEEVIIEQWRAFREEVLESFGDKPYRYEVIVKVGEDLTYEILSRTQGLVLPPELPKKGKAN